MEIKDVKKRPKKEVPISIRTTKEISDFMKRNKISPSAVFDMAIENLMKKK